MLILSETIRDDFEIIFKDLSFEKKILITAKENLTLEKDLKKFFNEVVFLDNYFSSAQLEVTSLDLYKKYKFSKIITSASSECDLLRSAQLREYLGLEGQNYKSALAFKDKIQMKDIVSGSGEKTAFYKEIKSGIDLIRFIDEYGYPVIIKPTREGSSIGIELIKNKHDLIFFLENNFNSSQYSNLMVESFVNGKMFHVDGFLFNNNIIAWPSLYKFTALDMMEGGYFANHLLSFENPLKDDLILYAKKILSFFPKPKNIAFHLEVFQDERGEFLFCEIGSRVGGGYIERMWKEAFDLSLREIYYHMQCNLIPKFFSPFLSQKKITGSVVAPRKNGKLLKISPSCPLKYISRYVTFCREGDDLRKSPHTSNALLSCFITASSEEDMANKIDGFIQWVGDSVVYEFS